MKYYTTITKDDSQAIFDYGTQEEALSKFHGEMKYAYDAHIPTTCYVTDSYGNMLKRERYELPLTPEELEARERETANVPDIE